MNESCDFDGAEFFYKLELREEMRDQLDRLVSKYGQRLTELGLRRIGLDDEEAVVEDASIRLMLLNIASLKLMLSTSHNHDEQIPEEYSTAMKQDLQAQLWSEGYSEPWFLLVEEEFLGDSLKPDDYESFLQKISAHEQESEKVHIMHLQLTKDMEEFLGAEYTPNQDFVLSYLGGLCGLDRMGSARISKNAEEARLYLINQGLVSRRWMALIDHFFGAADQS